MVTCISSLPQKFVSFGIFLVCLFCCVDKSILVVNAKRFCGGPGHAAMTRPCSSNDTDCGMWIPDYLTDNGVKHKLWWTPHSCHYRDVTPENARKCLGDRVIACVGDSMIRDICQAVVQLLLGKEHNGTTKFDYNDMNVDGTVIPDVPFWSLNVPPHNYNGYIYPKPFNSSYADHQWQVQMWSLYRREFMQKGQARDVLAQHMVNETIGIRKIDFLLWNHGLHDWGWFHKPPRGLKYYNDIIDRDYFRLLGSAKMPTVWVSMNKNCPTLLRQQDFGRDQAGMVDEANAYANQQFLNNRRAYWDADAVLRHSDTCQHSADGVHVKMYVDTMRAKMLFNHLCDHHWVWNKQPLKHFINN